MIEKQIASIAIGTLFMTLWKIFVLDKQESFGIWFMLALFMFVITIFAIAGIYSI